MKNVKFLALLSVMSVALFACSEGTYTPAIGNQPNGYTNPYGYSNGYNNGFNSGYNNGYVNPTQTGINGYNYNPYLQNTNPAVYQNNPMLQYQMQAQAQAMYSCQARANPFFYYQAYWNNNCGLRRQVTYTPSNCACIKAPCNCQQVLTQVSHSTNSGSSNNSGSSSNSGSGSSSGNTTPASNDGIDPNSKTLPLTITGEDAKALYTRLAKEEEELNNKSKTHARTGTIVKCLKDGRGRHDEDYACDFDVSVADGRIYELYPVGKIGQPDVASDTTYSGKNLQIGGTGLNTNEGLIKITGRIASYLYKKLSGEAKPGTLSGDVSTAANIKSGINVKCYETTATVNPVTECTIKLRVDSGEVLAQ